MDPVKQRFLAYLEFEKRYSPHTVTAYRTDLDQFSNYLLNEYGKDDLTGVDHFLVRSWMVSLLGQGIGPRSINRKLTTLKSFFRFLIREGVVTANPMKKVTSPKTARKLPVFLDREQADHLLDPSNFESGYSGLRDRLILECFYVTGIRLSELTGLNETDIDFRQETIKVLGKRNKERLVPFSSKMGCLLKEYIGMKRDIFGEMDALFLTDKGQPIYPRMIGRIVTGYMGRVTTQAKRSPHVLRHTFATHLLNNGAELNAVKELLGHANLSATQVYTHNTIEKLTRIYKQAHPKA